MNAKDLQRLAKRVAATRGRAMRARDFWVEVQVEEDRREEHLILAASEHAAGARVICKNYSLVSEGETRHKYWVGVKLKGDDADYQVAVRAPGKRGAIYMALDFPEVEQVTGCTTFARPGHIKWSPSV